MKTPASDTAAAATALRLTDDPLERPERRDAGTRLGAGLR